MDDRLVPTDLGLLALLAGSPGGSALAPFAREILLVECQVAGTSHRELQGAEPALVPGVNLMLRREPANSHDALAIMVFSEAGVHLGYVPRAKNEALARLMDAGKDLFARLQSKHWRGDWLCVEAKVYLRDL